VKERIWGRLLPLVGLFLLSSSILHAQDAVPREILDRTVCIKAGDEQGTAFQVIRNNRMYYITAGHMAKGLPDNNPTIEKRVGDRWEDLHVQKILHPSSPDADIAVLAVDEKPTSQFAVQVVKVAGGGPTIGQGVWFVGYPFIEGMGTKTHDSKSVVFPFIKHGIFSAVDGSNEDAVIWYLDGVNNEGFSGGPVVFWDFNKHDYEILAVVAGYKEDNARIVVNGEQVKTALLVNSGIVVTYSVNHAIDAIDKADASTAASSPANGPS
jgi:hypothetical protein